MAKAEEPVARQREHTDELIREALASGRTYAEAGALAGVSARTVRRRMSDPEFARGVSVRRGEVVGAIIGQLVGSGVEAVEVLRECLHSDKESMRFRSAHLLLTLSTQLRHAHELEERLAALEAGDVTEDET